MGQRQDLLAGAKQCIAEKGFSRTTARDIVAVSGANLASIGYHFGSKDALMTTAVLEAFDEWGDAVDLALKERAAGAHRGDAPVDRLEHFLTGLLATVTAHRSTAVSSAQMFAEAEFVPALRSRLESAYAHAARQFAALVLDIEPDEVDEEGRRLGVVVLSLVNGIVLHWLVAADATPSASEIAAAIRALVPPGRGSPAA